MNKYIVKLGQKVRPLRRCGGGAGVLCSMSQRGSSFHPPLYRLPGLQILCGIFVHILLTRTQPHDTPSRQAVWKPSPTLCQGRRGRHRYWSALEISDKRNKWFYVTITNAQVVSIHLNFSARCEKPCVIIKSWSL